MGVAGGDVYHPEVLAAHSVFDHIFAPNVAKANHRLSFHHEELLGLGVMVVVAARDARLGARDEIAAQRSRDLTNSARAAAGIAALGQIVGEIIRLQVGKIGAVELAGERVAEVRHQQRLATSPETTGSTPPTAPASPR